MRYRVVTLMAVLTILLSACTNAGKQSTIDSAADRLFLAENKEMRALRATAILAALSKAAVEEVEGPGQSAGVIAIVNESAINVSSIILVAHQHCAPALDNTGKCQTGVAKFSNPMFYNSYMLYVEKNLLALARLALPRAKLQEVLSGAEGGVLSALSAAVKVLPEAYKIGHQFTTFARDGLELRVQRLVATTLPDTASKTLKEKHEELKKQYDIGKREAWSKALKDMSEVPGFEDIRITPIKEQYLAALYFLRRNCNKIVQNGAGAAPVTAGVAVNGANACVFSPLENAVNTL